MTKMTLKEKVAVAQKKEYLVNEVKNYTHALNGRDSRFNNYYLQRIERLELELSKLEG